MNAMMSCRASSYTLCPARLTLPITALLCIPALCGFCANTGFVSVHDGQFWIEESPFVFTGNNTYYLMVYAADTGLISYVDEVMGKSAAMKITVIRTWAFNDGASQWNALQTSPGVYDEEVFYGLDYVLHRADQLGIRLILTLVNNWDDYGGMNQYVEWSPTASSHDQFYTDTNCRNYYKNHINRVLTQVNAYNNRMYKDDPTILAWELANEPRCASDPTGNTLDTWVAEMSAYIKSIDPNHLVTTGTEGFTGTQGGDFVRNHAHNTIDFSTFHTWHDWWWPSSSINTSLSWIRGRISDSHRTIIKPTTQGEFGKQRPTATRDTFYSQFYAEMNTYNAAGSNYWMQQHDDYPDYDGFAVYYPADSSTVSIIEAQSSITKEWSTTVHAFADAVESASAGAGSVNGATTDTLELPDNTTWSMGRGGEIVLRFDDNLLVDGPGVDLVVYEESVLDSATTGVDESATVSISTDGLSFATLGMADGTTGFDIGSSAINGNTYRYVKIEDDGDFSGEVAIGFGGYDLNAVRAVHARRLDLTKPVIIDQGTDIIVSHTPGTSASSNDPRNVLGFPGGPSLSLGENGTIILKFLDNKIADRPGPDLIVYEGTVLPDSSDIPEFAHVSVSADGSSFVSLGIANGTTEFDIASTGISEVFYVKVQDEPGGEYDNPTGGHGGYDLNAVCASNKISSLQSDLSADGRVDFPDLSAFSLAYGTTSGQANYNPDADCQPDGRVDFADLSRFSCDWGTSYEDPSVADINSDGCIDAADQAILSAAYGTTTTDPTYNAAADLNDNGAVDADDQDILDNHTGECPGL